MIRTLLILGDQEGDRGKSGDKAGIPTQKMFSLFCKCSAVEEEEEGEGSSPSVVHSRMEGNRREERVQQA